MARHLKGREQATEQMRPQRAALRPTERRAVPQEALPYGEGATYHYSYPNALRDDDYGYGYGPARGGVARPLRGLILLCAWAVRACAVALALLVMANVIPLPGVQRAVGDITDQVASYIPWGSVSALIVDTPFAGVFRGDIALLSFVLFVVDWALCRLRAALR